MNRPTFLLATIAALIATGLTVTAAAEPQRQSVAGINNFWRVDADISTGGTITMRDTAVPALKRRGIHTVIDLAGGAESEAERAAVEKAGMKYLVFAIDGTKLD